MRGLTKIGFIVYLLVELVIGYGNILTLDVIFLLLITASYLIRGKFVDNALMIGIESVIILSAGFHNPSFFILLPMLSYDLVYRKNYIWVMPIVLMGLWGQEESQYLMFILLLFLCSLFAYVGQGLELKEKELQRAFDQERRIRYELEEVKFKLIASNNEVEHFAEIKERNRIAREIHDSIGHNIAGLLMQLQVVHKLHSKEPIKSKELLKKTIEGLANTLVLLRETVHNIKPKENLGIDYINGILEDFTYCPVDLQTIGDLSSISSQHLVIITANIKEALTNVVKYSGATKVSIIIEANAKYTRLYIKDNGKGCKKIIESLGINSMKDRIKNVGGSISISGEDGFLIVCVIPKIKEGVGGVIANIDS